MEFYPELFKRAEEVLTVDNKMGDQISTGEKVVLDISFAHAEVLYLSAEEKKHPADKWSDCRKYFP